MTTALAVDVETLVGDYLRAVPAIAALGGQVGYDDPEVHCGADLPSAPRWPFINYYRIGGSADYPLWLDQANVQFDAWAPTRPEAHHAAATALAALADMPGSYAGGHVTATRVLLGLQYLPDRSLSPPRPRYVFSLIISVHP